MNNSIKELSSKEICRLLDHITSLPRSSSGNIIRPLFIWGNPGLGKTEMIKEYANRNNMDFCYVAPAQFEEMGDLHGIPEVENGVTVFRKPSWLPEPSERPGILLLDDVNRADSRIIKGLMQLAQLHKLMSWELPDNWTIVCTGNPDRGDFSTTPMDQAVLTRFIHVKLRFEKLVWADWAVENNIHPTAINFVLTYPETVTEGTLTNARTLTSFFKLIAPLEPWQDNTELIEILGCGLLDEETVKLFLHFQKQVAEQIPEPETILFSPDTEGLKNDLKKLLKHKNGVRLDLFNTVFNRLLVTCRRGVSGKINFENLVMMFTLEEVPNDMRTSMFIEFGKIKQENLLNVLSDPRVSAAILKAA